VALGAGVIGVLALAWSTADGRLRLELQSAVLAPISPRTVGREGSDEEIDRLRREAEALKNEITELTEAREQAAHTVAALKAAEQEPRNPAPSAYWYSNPAALTFGIESRPEPGGVVSLPRRPATARPALRKVQPRENRGPLPLEAPQ